MFPVSFLISPGLKVFHLVTNEGGCGVNLVFCLQGLAGPAWPLESMSTNTVSPPQFLVIKSFILYLFLLIMQGPFGFP